jgi:hypothetical protein
MVTRMLNRCGLYLGEESELLPSHETNPEGFWERADIMHLNDEVLSRLGGTWSNPPTLPKGWEGSPALEDLRQKARALVRQFVGCELWGWKDPRNCLILPFWRGTLGDFRVVICVRNPVEVALSLCRRDGFTLAEGLALWQRSHDQLLADVSLADCVVTHYAAFFQDPRGELRRILDQLEMTVPPQSLENACHSVSPTLRHGQLPGSSLLLAHREPGLLGVELSQSLVRTYDRLTRDAGPIYRAAESMAVTNSELRENLIRVGAEARLAQREYEVGLVRAELAQRDSQLEVAQVELAGNRKRIRDIEREVEDLRKVLADITGSLSFRLGFALTAPGRLLSRKWLGGRRV